MVPLVAHSASTGYVLTLIHRHPAARYEGVVLGVQRGGDTLTTSVNTPVGGVIGTIRSTGQGANQIHVEPGAASVIAIADREVEPDLVPEVSWGCVIGCLAGNVSETCFDACLNCDSFPGCIPCEACAGFWLVYCSFWVC